MLNKLRKAIQNFFNFIFRKKIHVILGVYGAPNSGKTTLANRMCKDWSKGYEKNSKGLAEKELMVGKVSKIPHETRVLQQKENLRVKHGRKDITFTLVDTPGITSRVDYADFVKYGIKKSAAKRRAREATKGVIESINELDKMDAVVVVLDATKDPYDQISLTLVGNLAEKKIPLQIVANKTDLRRAKPGKIIEAFPNQSVVPVSAKFGDNMASFYESLYDTVR